jgi:uncharacterized protein YbjQ (UPF0145 family)
VYVTTTLGFEGYRVVEYKGIVRGIIVRAPTIGQGFAGGLKMLIGGNIGAFTEMCEQAREEAFDLLVQHATERGANAIIGMHYTSADIGGGGGSGRHATEILCYGTAVTIEPVR